ncbi:MAG: carbohydrate ABC transporter permease [Chloroflexota bacterium]
METTVQRWNTQRYLQLAVLILLALWTLGPLCYMVATSFRTEADIVQHSTSVIPQPFTWDNYGNILSDKQDPILRWFFNSALVVVVGTFLVLVVASLAAYALARLEFPGRNAIFFMILASFLIPGVVLTIPTFSEIANVSTPTTSIFGHDLGIRSGLLDSYWALILPAPSGAFGVFLLRQFYLSIPRELEEAAMIDGAGKLRRWFQLILPLTRTPLLTLGILTFVGIYNDFLWPLLITQSNQMRTVTIGIALVTQGTYVNLYGPLMAFTTLGAIPTIVIFLVLQRHFVASAALSGVKG